MWVFYGRGDPVQGFLVGRVPPKGRTVGPFSGAWTTLRGLFSCSRLQGYLAHKKRDPQGCVCSHGGPGVGGRSRISEPLSTASEQTDNNSKSFEVFYLKVKASMWPSLSYTCHIRSTAARSYENAPPPQDHLVNTHFLVGPVSYVRGTLVVANKKTSRAVWSRLLRMGLRYDPWAVCVSR